MNNRTYRELTDDFARELLSERLTKNGGHILDTSRDLGMTYRECRYHIKRLGLMARPWKVADLGK